MGKLTEKNVEHDEREVVSLCDEAEHGGVCNRGVGKVNGKTDQELILYTECYFIYLALVYSYVYDYVQVKN